MTNVVNLPKMTRAKFVYFTNTGKFYSSADGYLRHDWVTLPNSPHNRRTQIMENNKGSMPGMTGRASNYFIHITTQDKQQILILPERSTSNDGEPR